MKKMLRTLGFAGRRAAPWVAPWVVAALLPTGCTLITDVDRSKIPEPPAIEPDPVAPDAGELGDAGGQEPDADASAPDAGTEPASDAGDLLDAGTPDADDAPADGG